MEQKEHKVEFFISNIGGKDSSEVIDLNKINILIIIEDTKLLKLFITNNYIPKNYLFSKFDR